MHRVQARIRLEGISSKSPLQKTHPNASFAMMLTRAIELRLLAELDESPAVALLGPRQSGKTTLALEVARVRQSLYLDLESTSVRARLDEPESF